jgi:hypothetical protein
MKYKDCKDTADISFLILKLHFEERWDDFKDAIQTWYQDIAEYWDNDKEKTYKSMIFTLSYYMNRYKKNEKKLIFNKIKENLPL